MSHRGIWLGIGAGALVSGIVSLFVIARLDRTVLPPTVSEPKTQVYGKAFSQATEAALYRKAVTSGTERAIAALEQALAAARARAEMNPAVISKLEEQLAQKQRKLELVRR